MVIEPLVDNPYTIATTEPPYDGSSSSSQQQLAVYNYNLRDPRIFPQPTIGSNAYLSGAVTDPGVHNANSNLGQNQILIAAEGSPECHRIKSNNALHYISQMMMEDVDERVGLYQGEAALQAAEKPFYDILGQVCLPTPLLHSNEQDSRDESSNNCDNRVCSSSNACPRYSMLQPIPTSLGPTQSLISTFWTSRYAFTALHFMKDVEEANRFVPSIDKLVIGLESNRNSMTTKAKTGEKSKYAIFEVRDQRNCSYIRDLDGRSSKYCAITSCEIIRNEKFDRVLLCDDDFKCFNDVTSLREMMAKEASKNSLKGSAQWKLQGKKIPKKVVVDLRALLIHCAQAVAADDRLLASQLLKNIRQHSSADGDSTQRMAFYLGNGLEARLAGIGSQVYREFMQRRVSTTEALEAYTFYLAACPFDRASYAFTNETIINVSKGQQKVHIIESGICFGFQWPSLMQQFARREGGPPELRITGIDVPRPGFRPCEMVEETGKRLSDYANTFRVPFQYQGIASRWESIQVQHANIEKDEHLIISCMFRMKNLGDETVAMNSARDRVLKTMRMNPKLFILGIVNGSYSSPFFITRFKEALFHYSSMFDMLDATAPRDNEERKMVEQGLFGQNALNIVACEGAERIERPESYKQWQARCLKAGFQQLPVDPDILKKIIAMNKKFYHENFFADEQSGWLLQGWKGRVVYAISTWKPSESYDDQ